MAAPAFVPALPGLASEPGLPTLRGTSDTRLAPVAAEEPQQGAARLLGFAATLTAFAGVAQVRGHKASKHRQACKTARAATAAAAAAGDEAEAEAPPPPFDPAQQTGVTEPLGFFDPLGFCKVGDEAGFRRLREAEMKHGRVAMMASLGLLVQSVAPFGFFEEVPRGIGAAYTPPGLYGLILIVIASGALELVIWKQDPEKEVGDFGDPAGWGIFYKDPDPTRKAEWVDGFKQRELNNGRFAMFATIGILAAELLTGKTAWSQFGFDFTITQ
mmetsp:Transcript_37221/g.89146  ORF Transcript_37221/g.89146 Transcript_37221/m.89146 type:complete len:272 (-) Transcript_37221:162-977(-)